MNRALFDDALEIVLAHEGYGATTDDPSDPGGTTRWGISLRFLRHAGSLGDVDGDGDVDAEDVRALGRHRVAELYRRHFWDRYGYGDFFEPTLSVKVFDLAVNMGPVPAHRCLQRACRACGRQVTDDGILGPETRAAANACGKPLVMPLRSEAAGYYRRLEARRPAFDHYLKGWLNRAYE